MSDQNIIYYAGGFPPSTPGIQAVKKVIYPVQELSLNQILKKFYFPFEEVYRTYHP